MVKMAACSSLAEGALRWWPSLAVRLRANLHLPYVSLNSASVGGSAFCRRASKTAVHVAVCHMTDSSTILLTMSSVLLILHIYNTPSCFFLRDFFFFFSSSFQAAVLVFSSRMKLSKSSMTWFRISCR